VSRPRLGALTLAVAALALGACGYSFRGTLPSHLQTVAVPIFVNRTSQPGVEAIITNRPRRVLESLGRFPRHANPSRD